MTNKVMAKLIIKIYETKGRVVAHASVEHSQDPTPQCIEHINPEELARFKELHKYLREKTIEWYSKNHPDVIPEQPLESYQTHSETSPPGSSENH